MITPGQVALKLSEDQGVADVRELRILGSRTDASGSLYEVPAWCEVGEQWRFQLGFLLRFILSGQPDFTRPVRRASWKESESAYRPAESHWYQRLYGLYSGQPAFGDDWLPITDWVEGLLLVLLRWPGCRAPDGFGWVGQGLEEATRQIKKRIDNLEQQRGGATRTLILSLLAKRPSGTDARRPLRACVVQTAIPAGDDFQPSDLALDDPAIRKKHRKHLSAALAADERMLVLRKTHKESEGWLDWLILPELAVHPNDVCTHLIPFARAHRAMILTGMTYEELLTGQPLVNSALWVIPEWSDAYGLQIRTRRQGKAHLAPNEQAFSGGNAPLLQGFRPCQWLVGYPWCDASDNRPIWLTAAVCYDATDLGFGCGSQRQVGCVGNPGAEQGRQDIRPDGSGAGTTTCSNSSLSSTTGATAGATHTGPGTMPTSGRYSTLTDRRKLRSLSSKSGTTIGMNNIKQRRLERNQLTSHPGLKVGDCVPFYFCPRSIMLYLISQANHPDLCYRGGQSPIVHLEADLHSTVAWANRHGRRWAFSLSNAGSFYFEDRADLVDLKDIHWEAIEARKWAGPGVDPILKEGKQAEFLVETSFPWQLVERIGVFSRSVFQQVAQVLGGHHHRPVLEIQRDWYY